MQFSRNQNFPLQPCPELAAQSTDRLKPDITNSYPSSTSGALVTKHPQKYIIQGHSIPSRLLLIV